MYSIRDDLEKGIFKRAYLLYGSERFLVHTYKDKLIEGIMHKTAKELDGDMNFTRYVGNAVDVKEVEAAASTMPFFAKKRMIVLDDTEWFKKSNDDVVLFLQSIPETTCVLFTETAVDKRSNTFRAIEKVGHSADFEELSDEQIKIWICQTVDKNYKKITKGAVTALMDFVGYDLTALNTELQKLLSYCLDKEAIERSDVEALIHPRATDRVFDMIEYMSTKRQQEALKLYYDLLELREAPLHILALMERQFRLLIAVKDLRNRGLNKNQIAERLNIKPFVADKCITQANHFEMAELKKALRDAARFENDAKSGGIMDRMAVELILIQNSTEKK